MCGLDSSKQTNKLSNSTLFLLLILFDSIQYSARLSSREKRGEKISLSTLNFAASSLSLGYATDYYLYNNFGTLGFPTPDYYRSIVMKTKSDAVAKIVSEASIATEDDPLYIANLGQSV